MSISGEKKARYSQDEFSAYNLKTDGQDAEGLDVDNQLIQSHISRYMKRAKGYLKNVSIGLFPSHR
mgnify:FL=1